MHARIDELTKPIVRIAEADYERLENLSRSSAAVGASLLADELVRSRVVTEAQAASEGEFVRLGSFVEYHDVLGGIARRVQLSAPDEADFDAGRLSVLSPVGAALIGLSAGDTFCWSGDDGRLRVLVVQRVAASLTAVARWEAA